jgi:hypothetical protein
MIKAQRTNDMAVDQFNFGFARSYGNIMIFIYLKIEGKVVPVLFLTRHHATKAYWGVEV